MKIINCKDCDGYEAGYSAGLKDAPTVDERPQGEWLDIYSTHIAYECSNCHMQMPITDYFNFCPNCGADMRKGGEEE